MTQPTQSEVALKAITVRVPEEIWKQAAKRCIDKGTNITEVVTSALQQFAEAV